MIVKIIETDTLIKIEDISIKGILSEIDRTTDNSVKELSIEIDSPLDPFDKDSYCTTGAGRKVTVFNKSDVILDVSRVDIELRHIWNLMGCRVDGDVRMMPLKLRNKGIMFNTNQAKALVDWLLPF